MRTALPALTTALLIAAVRLHRAALTRARTAGYLTACHDMRRGLLAAPEPTRIDKAQEHRP
jgi:hypothetical protein